MMTSRDPLVGRCEELALLRRRFAERAVEAHVRRILAKTGLTTRAELIRWFLTRQE